RDGSGWEDPLRRGPPRGVSSLAAQANSQTAREREGRQGLGPVNPAQSDVGSLGRGALRGDLRHAGGAETPGDLSASFNKRNHLVRDLPVRRGGRYGRHRQSSLYGDADGRDTIDR